MNHSLKVGQVARRIADALEQECREKPGVAGLVDQLGGIDPEVAEAVAYAHDIGTPPFGHTGESVLDQLVQAEGDPDGFEGNAQTFRVLTRLEVHKSSSTQGLLLTRAALRGVLKYPWLRHLDDEGELSSKWGAYRSDDCAFRFAMGLPVDAALREGPLNLRSLEAEIMDWADDVTYAVHDLEDFFRAGLVPLDRIARDDDFADDVLNRLLKRGKLEPKSVQSCWTYLRHKFPIRPYDGAPSQLRDLYDKRSEAISHLLAGFQVRPQRPSGPKVYIKPPRKTIASLLKALTWEFVIDGPGVAVQRQGQVRVVSDLYEVGLKEAREGEDSRLLPPKFREPTYLANTKPPRIAADFVSSLTEPEAYMLHRRLCGFEPGSVLDRPIGS